MTTLHLVSHTHWDREWYRTFQEFRFRLVALIDRLLDLMDLDPDYRFFTLDGQTIVLDDYLEVRPEQEDRLRRLVQSGRLLVGPWYVLPDEFLVGPEALLRNLAFGRRGCRRFTPEPQPMERIGYLPDPFGHIGQLPQIAAGFGLDALCVWRGVGDAPTEFRWAAPDGTERLVLHLRHSYSNGAWLGEDERAFVRGLAAERDALLPHATTSHLLIMVGTDHMEPRPDLSACIRAAEAATGDRVLSSTLPAYLAAVQQELGAGGLAALPAHCGELRSPQRSHLLPAVLSARIWIKQWNSQCETLLTRWAEPFSALAAQVAGAPARHGLLREGWHWLLQNHPHDSICGCSVDQVHDEMRTRFAWCEQIAEQVTQASLEALARHVPLPDAVRGSPASVPVVVFNPTPFCRTDRVRLRLPFSPGGVLPSLEAGDGSFSLLDTDAHPVPCRVLCRHTREHLNERMDRARFGQLLRRLGAEAGPNALPGSYRLIGLRTAGDTAYLELQVHTSGEGAPQEAAAEPSTCLQAVMADDRIQAFHLHAAEDAGLDVEFLARDVPGLGYAPFCLASDPGAGPPPMVAPAPPPSSTTIENEFFLVEAQATDGTLTVTDRLTGLVLRGVNRFVDGGDRGDEYSYCPPQHDQLVAAPAAPPQIHAAADPLGSSLTIDLVYRLPRALADGDRSRRSPEWVEMPIRTRVTLTAGVRRIEFETAIVNQAEDHRLRVHFPTPIVTDHSWAEGHFDVVKRPILLPQAAPEWAEQPIGTQPQLSFVDVTDGQRGVLLANRGLPEYEALPAAGGEPGVTLALTLLRCVGWLSRGDLANRNGHAGPALPTPAAQCPGQHLFHYALVPHAGNYLTAYREAHAFNAPLRAVCAGANNRSPIEPDCCRGVDGSLPLSGSFLQVEPGAVVLTALKAPEEGPGLVARIYNSAPVAVQARLKLWRPFAQATRLSLDESTALQSLASGTDALTLALRAKEIVTLRFQ